MPSIPTMTSDLWQRVAATEASANSVRGVQLDTALDAVAIIAFSAARLPPRRCLAPIPFWHNWALSTENLHAGRHGVANSRLPRTRRNRRGPGDPTFGSCLRETAG